jgi:mono/diheme cytochrome c family protein
VAGAAPRTQPPATTVAGLGQPAQPTTPAAPSAQDLEFFEAKIRPLLADACLECHAEDEKGGLRLDSREALLKGGESGPALVPGDPDNSLLVQVVRHVSGQPKMPRRKDKLPDAQIEALAQWVRSGAPWPASAAPTPTRTAGAPSGIRPEHREFWSFKPLASHPVPAVRNAGWARTDIDRFVLARLEKEGLTPVRAADKRTLLRRATLDLTGLPPTPAEVEAFERDSSPGAFDRVIDRLLASPRYGEAWGRIWLDVARYGEDDYRSLDPMGRGFNPYPSAYLYRDWVIKAFNDDLPYDQFVKAQLAADQLDESKRVRMVPALGFLGLGPWYYDNGAVEITRADERHDRVDAVTRGFLGLTVGCARCHDHKYDPIPTTDYYALAGVFLNTTYSEYPQAPKAIVEAYKTHEKTVERKEKLLQEYLKSEGRLISETLAFQASRYMQAAWKVTGEPKEDKARVVEDQKLDYELFDRWLRFLAKPPTFYPFLKSWQAMVAAGGSKEEAKKLGDEFQDLLLDVLFARKDVQEENEIITAKALPGTKKKERAKLPSDFVTNDDFCPGCSLELKSLPIEKQNLWTDVFSRDLEQGFDPFQVTERLRPGLLAFYGWGLERQLSGDRRKLVDDLRADLEATKKAMPPKFAYVHGIRDLETPVNLKVSVRGSPYKLGAEVPRRFLAVLSEGEPAPFSKGSGRLELAEAILRQPLAARVIVNRVWKGHFGTGLVDTPSNFGENGERPSNPALLDHLARVFLDRGMSIKALHREIMRSAVYQLGSDHSAAGQEKDPGNRLYWRANRTRMTAEQIRDAMLFVSGSLDERMGGPSTPLSPSFDRRTVYGKVSRYKLDEYLQLFDFPSPSQSAERRFTTTVPQQRLFLMNSDFVQQQGERLARRLGAEGDTPARIQKAYRLLYGRAATPAEVQAGVEFLTTEPLKQREERKTAAAKAEAPKAGVPAAPSAPQAAAPAPKPEDPKPDAGAKAAAPEVVVPAPKPAEPSGMMMGVVPGVGSPEQQKALLPVTPWGRYLKILLSSNEFLFVS